jgi:hypothetical protein
LKEFPAGKHWLICIHGFDTITEKWRARGAAAGTEWEVDEDFPTRFCGEPRPPRRKSKGTSTTSGRISSRVTERTCGIACDSYHRYAEDIEWMRKLGVNAYRMGIEWSRLQSEAGRPLHQAELARYVDQLDQLNAAGIVPMVVLHHFSNPPWINAIGGWTNAATIPCVCGFVTKAGGRLARSRPLLEYVQ